MYPGDDFLIILFAIFDSLKEDNAGASLSLAEKNLIAHQSVNIKKNHNESV